ncbi:putative Uroporphyrinogen decarboxylase [Hypsibius exemplaris]|uniref:Uroporphyrinogen decarboxylase n=1 Tax=Hypsibius exemplaris TaxID=2072580 RepID=A0A1W0X9U0_HYPEX|nr:putative Uroporphyrinogen decarboxylase [Hypsibius exemplaris]
MTSTANGNDEDDVTVDEYKARNFPAMKNTLILRAAFGEPIERVPVWIMRQAGRYLPEFRAARAEHDFFRVVQTPELACQVTLQPIDRFPGLDASIIFCDILVVPQALGMEGDGAWKGADLSQASDATGKRGWTEARGGCEGSIGIRNGCHYLDASSAPGRVPLIGFAGRPGPCSATWWRWRSPTQAKAKRWLYVYPDATRKLLSILTRVICDFLVAQVEAGAQMLQVRV